ncbi:MAG: flagellar motor protein [Vicinamibacterales bacterium]
MRTRPAPKKFELATVLGIPAAIAVVLLAQMLEGAPARALWQPTAALVVFGGTLAAVLVSYPFAMVRRTATAVRAALFVPAESTDRVLADILNYSNISRRRGVIALEPEIDQAEDTFLRMALSLAADNTSAKVSRQILEVESDARREIEEAPAEVLETAAGYSPTLGILGAVLGLIHVMQSLSDPSKLGGGIAVAFVATVYGVAGANLVLLPLATRLRGNARRTALIREIVIEGMVSVQEGVNPRVIEQKLRGFMLVARREEPRVRRAA